MIKMKILPAMLSSWWRCTNLKISTCLPVMNPKTAMTLRHCANPYITTRLLMTISNKQTCQYSVTGCQRQSNVLHTSYGTQYIDSILCRGQPAIHHRCLSTSNMCCKKSNEKKKQRPSYDTDESDYDSEDESGLDTDEETVDDDGYESDEEEMTTVKGYKDIRHNVSSLRIDAVISKGLNISRKKVEDAFLGTKLRVNGRVISKKGKKVNEGDTIDVIKGPAASSTDKRQEKEDMVSMMRVVVKEILPDKTATDKTRIVLRRWKNINVPKSEIN